MLNANSHFGTSRYMLTMLQSCLCCSLLEQQTKTLVFERDICLSYVFYRRKIVSSSVDVLNMCQNTKLQRKLCRSSSLKAQFIRRFL